jgi:hypothetical protein
MDNHQFYLDHRFFHLFIIFGFVLCLALIRRYFRYRHDKMWHETTRLALEKGQPLPRNWSNYCWRGRGSAAWDLRRGLVLIAVGAALYYALPADSRLWAALPGFIGIAYLIFGLFSYFRSDSSSDPRNRDASDKK